MGSTGPYTRSHSGGTKPLSGTPACIALRPIPRFHRGSEESQFKIIATAQESNDAQPAVGHTSSLLFIRWFIDAGNHSEVALLHGCFGLCRRSRSDMHFPVAIGNVWKGQKVNALLSISRYVLFVNQERQRRRQQQPQQRCNF